MNGYLFLIYIYSFFSCVARNSNLLHYCKIKSVSERKNKRLNPLFKKNDTELI